MIALPILHLVSNVSNIRSQSFCQISQTQGYAFCIRFKLLEPLPQAAFTRQQPHQKFIGFHTKRPLRLAGPPA